MHVGNYYVSIRKLSESERKIRVRSLTKFSGIDLCQISTLESKEGEIDYNIVYDWYNHFSDGIVEIVPDNSDINAIYYVAGALDKMEMANKSCQSCKSLLQVEDHPDNPCSSEEDID